jgi:hypothetical protein
MFELDVHMVDVWKFCSLRHMHCPFVGFDAVMSTGGLEIFPCAKSMSPLGHPLPVNILAGDRQLAARTSRSTGRLQGY